MSLQTLKLSQIKTSDANPRKGFNDKSLLELAQSIKNDGLLQNLVVCQPKGKKKTYSIICGERRFRALCLLKEQGELTNDFEIPVEVRGSLSEDEILRLATVENLQREDMHPMDEAVAIASLVHAGEGVDDISAKTGLSAGLIKRRMILIELCDQAQEATRAGDITLSQAEALSLGTHSQQQEILEDGISYMDADDIRSNIFDESVNVSYAIFPRERYTGTYTTDLFGADADTYFDDREQFMALQKEAITEKIHEYAKGGFAPVEVIEEYYWDRYKYRDVEEGEKGGVVIHVHPSGSIEFHEGLINRQLDKKVTDDITVGQEKKKKPFYSRPVMEQMAMYKSIAVQQALLSNPRKAKEMAVIQLLECGEFRMNLSIQNHKCVEYFDNQDIESTSMDAVRNVAKDVLAILGQEDFSAFGWRCDAGNVYLHLKTLSDVELDKVHLFFTTMSFGQANTDTLDCQENSLFNILAQDLEIDMNALWYPNAAFLSKRNKDQLADIVEATQSSSLFGSVQNWKKGDLVKKLSEHLKRIYERGAQTPEEETAENWLPEAMLFPAVDPDNNV